MSSTLKAPFPYFGGKSAVADLVWERLGNPDNYVEPFAGSIATLLRRPEPGRIETINDRNHFVTNFWRAVKLAPDRLAAFADHPVNEADLHARHDWLMRSKESAAFRDRMIREPDYFDSKIAGWWVWGQCCWIGGGWCDDHGETSDGGRKKQMPVCDGRIGKGVNSQSKQVPDLAGDSGAFGRGVNSSAGMNRNKLPLLNSNFDQAGTGIHQKRPLLDTGEHRGVVGLGRHQLGDAFDVGRGVNSNKHAGTCRERLDWLQEWIGRLSDRLRLVRVCYGHWSRICDSKTTMDRLGLTGAFVDPPYAKSIERVQALIRGEDVGPVTASNRANELYAGDKTQDIDALVAEVNRWCQKWGRHSKVRIALCGYEGEHDNLVADHGWTVEAWKAQGGYANRNENNQNNKRERIWFSPACIHPSQGGYLF